MGVVVNAFQESLANAAKASLYEVRLYKNDQTPGVTDSAGAYTNADFSGYSSITSPSWPDASEDGGKWVIEMEFEFTHDGGGTGNTIYGYYVVDSGGNLVMAHRFGSPVDMSSAKQLFVTVAYSHNEE